MSKRQQQEKSSAGSEDAALQYGAIGSFGRQLSKHLREKGMHMTPRQWKNALPMRGKPKE